MLNSFGYFVDQSNLHLLSNHTAIEDTSVGGRKSGDVKPQPKELLGLPQL